MAGTMNILSFLGSTADPDSPQEVAALESERLTYARVARKVAQATRNGAKPEFSELVTAIARELEIRSPVVHETVWHMIRDGTLSLDAGFRLARSRKVGIPAVRRIDPASLFSVL